MKKYFFTILSVLTAVCLLVSCGAADVGAKVVESSETLLVIEATSTGGSLEDALNSLAEAGELSYDGSESEYGFYITSVNGYTPDASANEYWAIYTTLGEYEGVQYSSAEFGSYNYSEKTCASASYGVSGIPMVESELYILAVESY